jgi:hypothetical protein
MLAIRWRQGLWTLARTYCLQGSTSTIRHALFIMLELLDILKVEESLKARHVQFINGGDELRDVPMM